MKISKLLHQEHEVIIKLFDQYFKTAQSNGKWDELIQLCENTYDKNHHEKEERYLFAVIKDDPRLKLGGPYCTFYFDYHMAAPPLQKAQELIYKITELKLQPQWSPLMEEVAKTKIPLLIPGEDHEAARMLVRAVNYILKDKPEISAKIPELFKFYRELTESHIEREEQCFLKMCENLIPSSKQERLFSEMKNNYKSITSDLEKI